MKKIKSSTLVENQNYYYSLYSDKNKKFSVTLKSRPECQIGLMEPTDKFIFEDENGETIEFRRNNGNPGFLITDIAGKKPNSMIQDRVVFYKKEE
ncbi:MAG: hypothetical protein [Caudoviricetes sp.]|nr:MAG: hypothetical protein [Caudoviricetes sp.]